MAEAFERVVPRYNRIDYRMNFGTRQHAISAFTLVEVVLAIAISIGLMLVALFFYSQCANLRTQLLDESDKIGTVRLLLQKITTELRSAQSQDQFGFTGASNSIEFVKSGVLPLSSWNLGSNAPVQYPSGLSQVHYELISGLDGTNLVSLGIARRESPLNVLLSTNFPMQSLEADNATNLISGNETNGLIRTNVAGLLTDKIHTMQFRYWDGTTWTNTWDDIDPPAGVEIILAMDLLDPADTNAEIYRRVVVIPGGTKAKRETDEDLLFATKL
jgi:type II secretory pathway pseudopilin PulG